MGQVEDIDGELIKLEISKLGLESNILELEEFGLTIIQPDSPEQISFAEQLKQKLLIIAEKKLELDFSIKDSDVNFQHNQYYLYHLLFEDKIFQEAVCYPKTLAVVRYLLGKSCLLYNCVAQVKTKGDSPFQLHCDNFMQPPPLPEYAQHANATWALTDYSEKDGGLCYVPGSHKFCRQPKDNEGIELAKAVEAKAGSLIIWHGNTWHTGLPKKTDNYRVNLINTFCRKYIRPQENYSSLVTPEVLKDCSDDFSLLMGAEYPFDWSSHNEANLLLESRWQHIWPTSYSKFS
ncbi:MAG: phytanoyl-CoA dioxygenase family protein [Alphaproteobacteria bacterium]|jgi:hypothetical protein|tara:strand:+ start:2982 stop:3854 length:873 start_codon:yes stop_codon:yes gene_type:complete